MTGHFTSYETRTDHELATSGVQDVDKIPWIATKITWMTANFCVRVEGAGAWTVALVGSRRRVNRGRPVGGGHSPGIRSFCFTSPLVGEAARNFVLTNRQFYRLLDTLLQTPVTASLLLRKVCKEKGAAT
jgi:hypothetical protein